MRDHLRRLILGEIAIYQYLRKGRPAPLAVLRWQGVAITLYRVSVRNKAAAARRLLPKIQELLALRATTYKSLARANGWGSAGQCPAPLHAKTPAERKRVCRVAAAGQQPVTIRPVRPLTGQPVEGVV